MESQPEKAVPFVDKVTARLEQYPELSDKYADKLYGDPLMQTAVWVILDVADACRVARDEMVRNEQIQSEK